MNEWFNSSVNVPGFQNVEHFGIATSTSEFSYYTTTTKNYARTIIKAPTGVCALYQDSNSVKEIYYIHTDYQGSWLAITNSAKVVKNRYSYDAWGRPRNYNDWLLKSLSVNSITNALLNLSNMQPRFDRGYTGHEMVCGFGLINMNGRLYDPYLQRFLSPDPYVQSPGNAQSYNRYSYCMNNPLMYTDPSGYSWWSRNRENIAKVGGIIVAVGVGIAVGVATAGIGNIVIAGFMSGYAAGFAGGFAGTALNGGTLDQCMFSACLGGWAGGATGVATAGVMAGIGYGLNCTPAPSSWGNCVVGNGTSDIVSRYSATLGNWATHFALVAGNALGTSASGFGGAVGGGATGAISGLASGGSYISSYSGIADNTGGFINNRSDFMSFMNHMASNNSVEVSAYRVNNGYYINPWNGNKPELSINQPCDEAISQFHTHPNSSCSSYSDLMFSKENRIPVFSMGSNGDIWMVNYFGSTNSFNIGIVPMDGIDESTFMKLFYATKIR